MNSRFLFVLSTLSVLSFRATGAVTMAPIGNVAPAYYIPVTLTNSQGAATATNLQVKVTVNSNANSSLYAAKLSNANWQDGSGQILNSWLESGDSNTSTASVYWINLGNRTVSASGGTLVIYQAIYSTGTNALDATTTGAYPNYSGTYGQYDNGSSVFTNYWNFAGTSLPAGWMSVGFGSGYSYTINNGVSLSETDVNSNISLVTSATYNVPIIESNFTLPGAQTTSAQYTLFYATTSLTTSGGDYGYQNAYRYDYDANSGAVRYRLVRVNSGSGAGVSTTTMAVSSGVWTAEWPATGSQRFVVNSSAVVTGADSSISKGAAYIGVSALRGGYVNFTWFRTRAYPPSGVLPTSSGSAVVNMRTKGFLPIF